MRLETARIIGTPLAETDLAEIAALHTDPAVMATMGGIRAPEVSRDWLAESVEHWRVHGIGLFALRLRSTGEFIGRGGLRRTTVQGRDEVEINYALHRDYWGQGYATEAAQAFVVTAAAEGIPEVVAFALIDNVPSRRVMEKAGFVLEAEFVWAEQPHALYRRPTAP